MIKKCTINSIFFVDDCGGGIDGEMHFTWIKYLSNLFKYIRWTNPMVVIYNILTSITVEFITHILHSNFNIGTVQ